MHIVKNIQYFINFLGIRKYFYGVQNSEKNVGFHLENIVYCIRLKWRNRCRGSKTRIHIFFHFLKKIFCLF